EQFIEVVRAGRPNLDETRIRTLADGRVYLAPQALEAGLIDRIGTLEEAFEAAKDRAGIKRARIIRYHRPLGWRPTWYAQAPSPSAPAMAQFSVTLGGIFTTTPRFLYVWLPGR
ncbi:MAG: S49 family peptidase, partial [Phycisphaerae bacterium]